MAAHVPQNFRRVITAAAGGNVIEWYDFYIFGSLAAVLSVKFFEKGHLSPRCLARSHFSCRIPDPSVGSIPVRLDGRPRRP